MFPAASVILFTTASGAGYGLMAWLGLCAALGLLPPEPWFGFVALGLTTLLITGGLLSSVFHLGRPERAWRAFSQWRSSWLAREGVAAVAVYFPALALALGWIVLRRLDGLFGLAGVAVASLSLTTVACTAMIYQSLKPIRQWNHRGTIANYLLLAAYTGALLLTLLTLSFGLFRPLFGETNLALLIAAAVAKALCWRSIDAARPRSTLRSATGLTDFTSVRLFEAPHTEANFIMREMGFVIARKHARKLRGIAAIALFALPGVLLLAALALAEAHLGLAIAAALVATLSAGIGIGVERWLFFAEATHSSMLYYGGG
jgi:DMSO reductase anchor subunit